MYLTKREKEFQKAQESGKRCQQEGWSMPSEYKDDKALAEAWSAGYSEAQKDYNDYWDGKYHGSFGK